MLVNKKLDRFKQWAGERMGGEVKTNTTDQFKALEQEMDLRQQGMEKMQEATSIYMKAISKRTELEKKEKTLPIAHLGTSMVTHGEDFEHDSEYGQCLTCKFLAFSTTHLLIIAQHLVEHKNVWPEHRNRILSPLPTAGAIVWNAQRYK